MRLSAIGLALIFSSAGAQEVDNMNVFSGTDSLGILRYAIRYDLIAPHANIPCSIRVKFTAGDRQFYLKQVTGDVGNLVYPGKEKRIAWDIMEELIYFKGEDITLLVEVSPNVQAAPKVKRGKQLSIRLDDIYTKGKTYAMKLYSKEKEVARLNDMMVLDNSFVLEIPGKTKVGSDYQLSITDGEKVYFSNVFQVKPKVGMFWKLSPLLLVPVYMIIQKQSEDNQPLPAAPDSPGGE